MKGIISFHPVDVGFFDEIIGPQIEGRKIDLEPYLVQAARIRRIAWRARCTTRAIETIIRTAGPAKPRLEDGFFRKLRVQLEALDYRPDEATKLIAAKLEPDLHLHGRPFFVTEVSAARVANLVEEYRIASDEGAVDEIARKQLAVLDPALARLVVPEDSQPLSRDSGFCSDLLSDMTRLAVLSEAARREKAGLAAGGDRPVTDASGSAGRGGSFDGGWRKTAAGDESIRADAARDEQYSLTSIRLAMPRVATLAAPATSPRTVTASALAQLCEKLPWMALSLHARIVPFWIARDLDGLETVCRAVGIAPPDCMVPARRLFAEALETVPELAETLRLELAGPRQVGAFVPPADIGDLLDFLSDKGARIISSAVRQGEGAACTSLLRKIKECATYGKQHGLGYLEASAIPPLGEGAGEAGDSDTQLS